MGRVLLAPFKGCDSICFQNLYISLLGFSLLTGSYALLITMQMSCCPRAVLLGHTRILSGGCAIHKQRALSLLP